MEMALKQAARENDATRMEALCETWSLPTAGPVREPDSGPQEVPNQSKDVTVTQTSVAGRR